MLEAFALLFFTHVGSADEKPACQVQYIFFLFFSISQSSGLSIVEQNFFARKREMFCNNNIFPALPGTCLTKLANQVEEFQCQNASCIPLDYR